MGAVNDFPRRNRLDLNTPTELAIHEAIQQIERMPANEKLTEAVVILIKAKSLVSDYVDSEYK